jgi:hypothetical protein
LTPSPASFPGGGLGEHLFDRLSCEAPLKPEDLLIQRRVAAAVAAAVEGRAEFLDSGGGDGMRDYDLLYDGVREPLEVTTTTRKHIRAMQAQLDSVDVDAPNLGRSWLVHMANHQLGADGRPERYSVRKLLRRSEPVLRELEDMNRARFDAPGEFYGAPPKSSFRQLLREPAMPTGKSCPPGCWMAFVALPSGSTPCWGFPWVVDAEKACVPEPASRLGKGCTQIRCRRRAVPPPRPSRHQSPRRWLYRQLGRDRRELLQCCG